MTALTRILEGNPYAIAVLAVYALSSPTLAEVAYHNGLAARGWRFATLHVAVMGFVVVWGALVFDLRGTFRTTAAGLTASVLVGISAGFAASWCDRKIVRALWRRASAEGGRPIRRGRPAVFSTPYAGPFAAPRASACDAHALRASPPRRDTQESPVRDYGATWLVVVAVLEEVIYRGLLVRACFLLPTVSWVVAALVASAVLFALAHLRYGWTHVLAKLPLGALTLTAAVGLGTVWPAVVTHVVFNLKVLRDARGQPLLPGGAGEA